VQAAATLPTLVARHASLDVGFITLAGRTRAAFEIVAMGVLPDWHRRGIGRALVEAGVRLAKSRAARLLQVKTLGASHPSEAYARTRAFYDALGFLPLEETICVWGEANPCLILVKPLA
jgi:GNAT superfamily N-acetyltransferase